MTAGSHKTVHPHLPKTEDRCVRLIIDFSSMEELIGFTQSAMGDMCETHELSLYKVTASQYHSVPVGNHYIIASGGHYDMKLTPNRIASIMPSQEEVAEEENYNDHKDKDAF